MSTHLTIGVHPWTRYALAEQMLAQALRTVAQDPQLRTSLPLGVDFGDLTALRAETDLIQAALVEAVQRLDHDRLSRTLQQASRGTQRAAPIGPLRQLRDAERIGADTDSCCAATWPRPWTSAAAAPWCAAAPATSRSPRKMWRRSRRC